MFFSLHNYDQHSLGRTVSEILQIPVDDGQSTADDYVGRAVRGGPVVRRVLRLDRPGGGDAAVDAGRPRFVQHGQYVGRFGRVVGRDSYAPLRGPERLVDVRRQRGSGQPVRPVRRVRRQSSGRRGDQHGHRGGHRQRPHYRHTYIVLATPVMVRESVKTCTY